MFGVYPFGVSYPAQAPNIAPPTPIELDHADASLFIVAHRNTTLVLAPRQTLHRMPFRDTSLEVTPRLTLHKIPTRNTNDGEG